MKKTVIYVIVGAVVLIALVLLFKSNGTPTQPTGNTTTTTTTSVDTEQLTITVEAFMMSTLGTLSNGNIDLAMAAELTTPSFAQQIPDFTAIPIIYGIQQGPDDISIGKPQIVGNAAIIDVDGLWGGEAMQSWTFELTPDSADIWRINNIIPAE